MKGIICLWSGAIVDIPAGWGLCDGTQGTPNLKDRFVIGAGSVFSPGASGGGSNHVHSFTSSSHNHSIPGGTQIQSGGGYSNATGNNTVSGTTDSNGTLPPFYALAFIMKL